MYEEFEQYFKKKYPYPTSLLISHEQKQHLQEAFVAGAKSVGPVMTKEEMENVDLFLKELYGGQLQLNRKE